MPVSPELKALLREKAQKKAEELPPLTQEQIARLRILLRGGRG